MSGGQSGQKQTGIVSHAYKLDINVEEIGVRSAAIGNAYASLATICEP